MKSNIYVTAYGKDNVDRGIHLLSFEGKLHREKYLSLSGKCNLVLQHESYLILSVKYANENKLEIEGIFNVNKENLESNLLTDNFLISKNDMSLKMMEFTLSIKKALEPEKSGERRDRRERRNTPPPKPDGSYTWMTKKQEPASFEEMMNRFKQTSDEKFSDLKRKNPDAKRSKRSAYNG